MLVLFVSLGIAGSMLVGIVLDHHRLTYTANTRMVLDTSDTKSLAEATAVADLARALATSPGHVLKALQSAGVQRDPTKFARDNVKVQVLGTSGVIQLSVTDHDPAVAAEVVNSLADDILRTRQEIASSPTDKLVADLNDQIKAIDTNLADLRGQEATATDVARSAIATKISALQGEKTALEVKKYDLLAVEGARPKARIVERAQPPTSPDLLLLIPDMGLGLLIGLLAGVLLTALLETARPTLVGADALARFANAPLIGELPASPDAIGVEEAALLRARLTRAAEAADLDVVELFAARRHLDLGLLADALSEPATGGPNGPSNGAPRSLIVRLWEPAYAVWPTAAPHRTAAVLVAPTIISKGDLTEAVDTLTATGWPLLGVVAYRPQAGRSQKLSRSAGFGPSLAPTQNGGGIRSRPTAAVGRRRR